MKRLRLVVKGRVQGVGFRYFTYVQASHYGLKGYVQNRIDGSVEIEVEGPENSLLSFVTELRKGPRYGHIDEIERAELPLANYTNFQISG